MGKLSDFSYLKDYKNVYRLFKFWEAASKKSYWDKFKTLLIEWNRATLVERFFGYEDILTHMGFGFDKDSCEISIFDEIIFRRTIEDFIKWLNPKNAEKITTQMVTKNTIYNYFNRNFFKDRLPSEQLNVLDSTKKEESKSFDGNEYIELNINEARLADKKNQKTEKEENINRQEEFIKKTKTRAHSNDNKTDFINIHTLHQYVHNSNIFPKHDDLKTTWDNLGTLLQIIWSPMEAV